MLKQGQAAGTIATNRDGGRPPKNVSNETTHSPKTLPEIGITRDEASKFKKLAEIPDDDGAARRWVKQREQAILAELERARSH